MTQNKKPKVVKKAVPVKKVVTTKKEKAPVVKTVAVNKVAVKKVIAKQPSKPLTILDAGVKKPLKISTPVHGKILPDRVIAKPLPQANDSVKGFMGEMQKQSL